MEPVIVVGAGLSGIACARTLSDAGVPVRVLDRGHRVGGRMASRRIAGRPVDLGASYLTASDADFEQVVADWEGRGLARRWTTTISTLGPDGRGPDKDGPQRWGASGGLRSLVADLATGIDVEAGTVTRVAPGGEVDGRPAAAVVLAMPDPQARRLLDESYAGARAALDRDWEPTIAVAAGWAERHWDLPAAFVDDPDVSFVADDGSRRGDGAPVLVAHSTPERAARHLDDPDSAAAPLLDAVRRLLDLPPPEWHQVHRWTFARPAGSRDRTYGWFEESGTVLGVCGDGWAEKSRVESAYLSGRDLGRSLAARLGTLAP